MRSDRGFQRLMRGETNVDIVGRPRTWAITSGIIVVIAVIGLVGPRLNFSLEFEGGSSLIVPVETDAGVPEFSDALGAVGIEGIAQIVTRPDGGRDARVRTKVTDEGTLLSLQREVAEVAGHVDQFGNPDVNEVSRTTIGPVWGQQITNQAVRGLIVFLVLVSFYISIRFEWKMAIGALAALFHDLIVTAGVYALVGFEVSPATVIALLTLMGYSLYDTVVVFDRVKENTVGLSGGSKVTYSQAANRALNEVLMRSINTSASTILPISGILFVGVFLFGAVTLKDLALAMFVGSIAGTYSSIFVATPLLAVLKEREPQYQAIRKRLGDLTRPLDVEHVAPKRAVTVPAPAEREVAEERPEQEPERATASPARRPAAAGPPRPVRPPRKRRGKRRGKRR